MVFDDKFFTCANISSYVAPMIFLMSLLLFLDGRAIADWHTCKYQQRICECNRSASICNFTLIVEDLLALVSYQLVESDSGQLDRQLNGDYTQMIQAN